MKVGNSIEVLFTVDFMFYASKNVWDCTVKLGYYELGYNELPVITNFYNCLVGSSQTNKTFSRL